MALPTPGTTPANWGAALNAEVLAAQVGALPVGRYVQLAPDANDSATPGKGTEYSWPFRFVGPADGLLDRVGFYLNGLSTDVGTIVRFGIRADNSGVAGSVLTETSVPAVSADGGSTGYKELTVSLGLGKVYWFSLCSQGSGTSNPRFTACWPYGAFTMGGYGGSQTTPGWASGHGPQVSVIANTSGTLASTSAPGGAGTNTFNGQYVPLFIARRGS